MMKPDRSTESPLPQTGGFRSTVRAFESRNYRLYFGGQLISLVGSWMQTVALSWLVYRLTGSAFLLGLVGFVSQIPALVLSPLAGVFVDRWNKHRMLVVTQAAAMLQASLLAVLVLSGTIQTWHIIALSLFLGVVNSVDGPTRQAFVIDIIERREHLGNAIALNSAMFNGARLVGPSVAGIMLAAAGEGVCFLLNAVSFVAVIAALLAMRLPAAQASGGHGNVLARLREGFRYALRSTPIRSLLGLVVCTSLLGMPYMVLLPIFAEEVLRGGPQTYGFLLAAAGTGALIGALYLASRQSHGSLWETVAVASTLFGAGLIAFSLSRALALSLLVLVVAGFGMMVQFAATNTLLQTIVEDDKRGRLMSIYTMAFMGIVPFGSLLAGAMANRWGVPETQLLGGIGCLVAGLVFASRLTALRSQVLPVPVDAARPH